MFPSAGDSSWRGYKHVPGLCFVPKGQGDVGRAVQLNDPSIAYNNLSAYTSLSAYSEVGKEVHGSEWDSSAHDLDGEVVMRAGGGKKHGWYYLGDNVINMASTPTLSQI